jgi:hypothetical protein
MPPVLMRHPRLTRPVLLLLPVLVFPLLSACPKQQPPEDAGASTPAEPSLQISNLDPASTIAGEPVTVTARGTGFVQGSKVYLGTIEARGVDVFSDGELTFRASESLEVGAHDVRIVTPTGEQAVAPSSFSVRPRPEESADSVRLEGHADERGSTIFNLSLGEERAEVVRDYLIDLGVDRGVFTLVSYGEERPVKRGFNEESWAENRRVEFAVQ